MNTQPLVFELERQQRPVTIGGEEYILVELDGLQRDKYLTNLGHRIRTSPDGKTSSVKDFDGLQASLLTAALLKVEGDGNKPVKASVIQAWPARVVSALFKAAKELSQLDDEEEKEEEEEKKGND